MFGWLDVLRASGNIVSFTFMGLGIQGEVRFVFVTQCIGDSSGWVLSCVSYICINGLGV